MRHTVKSYILILGALAFMATGCIEDNTAQLDAADGGAGALLTVLHCTPLLVLSTALIVRVWNRCSPRPASTCRVRGP